MSTQAEWRPDPGGQYDYRWWDGQKWTDQVATGGQTSTAPLPENAQAPAQASLSHAEKGHAASPQAQVNAFHGISGDLVDGRFSEKENKDIANQNAQMLRIRVRPHEPFVGRQGAMVAYQGKVDFAYKGAGGIGKFLKKAVTGEGFPTMKVSGDGDVFLADQAKYVHILHLTEAGLSINGSNLLAYSESLTCDIERVKGASMLAGGLFNTTLRGSGWVAITTDGPPVLLNTAEAPTYADTNAIVCWSADIRPKLSSSFKAGALIGRGSGEMFQLEFQGNGFIIVQPSEGIAQSGVTG